MLVFIHEARITQTIHPCFILAFQRTLHTDSIAEYSFDEVLFESVKLFADFCACIIYIREADVNHRY